MRYELADHEWAAIKPMLPNKPRGVPRVNDRRVLNGIFWVSRSGAPWRDLPDSFGPYTACYNRFVRWRRAGVWDRIMSALATTRVNESTAQLGGPSSNLIMQADRSVRAPSLLSVGRTGGRASKFFYIRGREFRRLDRDCQLLDFAVELDRQGAAFAMLELPISMSSGIRVSIPVSIS
jgi:transposase